MAVPGQAWCWTSNACLKQPDLSACDYTHQVCNDVQYCKCTSCTDPVCGSPFACVNDQCVPSTSGLPREDCQALCGEGLFHCVANQCVPASTGLPKATCEAHCGHGALLRGGFRTNAVALE